MQSANCVCIDRSVSLPKCYVGIQKGWRQTTTRGGGIDENI
jgi:hypothetical protein